MVTVRASWSGLTGPRRGSGGSFQFTCQSEFLETGAVCRLGPRDPADAETGTQGRPALVS